MTPKTAPKKRTTTKDRKGCRSIAFWKTFGDHGVLELLVDDDDRQHDQALHQLSKSATPTTGIAPIVAPMFGIRSVMATKRRAGRKDVEQHHGDVDEEPRDDGDQNFPYQ